jgi:hypothetical protein
MLNNKKHRKKDFKILFINQKNYIVLIIVNTRKIESFKNTIFIMDVPDYNLNYAIHTEMQSAQID